MNKTLQKIEDERKIANRKELLMKKSTIKSNNKNILNASKTKKEPFFKKIYEQDVECNNILEDLEQKKD